MRDVADPVRALRVHLRLVGAVGGDRRLVRPRRVGVAAGAHVDVGRHVQQVAGAGHERAQAVRAGERAPGLARALHHVDPVVVGARMVRRELQRAREQVGRCAGPRLRRAVGVPPVVRVEVEFGLGGEHQDLGVARKLPRELAHLRRVGLLVDGRGVGVARRKRRDQRLMARRRAGGQRPCPGEGRRHAGAGRGVHVGVDVRALRPRQRPPAGGALRVGARRGRERARGLGRIEAPRERHALLEIPLREGRRGPCRRVVGAQAVEQRRVGPRCRPGKRGMQCHEGRQKLHEAAGSGQPRPPGGALWVAAHRRRR